MAAVHRRGCRRRSARRLRPRNGSGPHRVLGSLHGRHLHGHAVHADAEGGRLRGGTGAGSAAAGHRRLRSLLSGRQPQRRLAHPDHQRSPFGVEAGDLQLPVAHRRRGHRALPRAEPELAAGGRGSVYPSGRIRGRRTAEHGGHGGAHEPAGAPGLGRRDLRRGHRVAGGPRCGKPRFRGAPVQHRRRPRGPAAHARGQPAERALRRWHRRSGAAAATRPGSARRARLRPLHVPRRSDAEPPRRGRPRPGAGRGALAGRHRPRFLGLSPRPLRGLPRRRPKSPRHRPCAAPGRTAEQLRQRHRQRLLHRRPGQPHGGGGRRTHRTDSASARRRFAHRIEPAAARRAASASSLAIRRLRREHRRRSGRSRQHQAVHGDGAREERDRRGNSAHRVLLLRPRSRGVPQRPKRTDRALGGRRAAGGASTRSWRRQALPRGQANVLRRRPPSLRCSAPTCRSPLPSEPWPNPGAAPPAWSPRRASTPSPASPSPGRGTAPAAVDEEREAAPGAKHRRRSARRCAATCQRAKRRQR